NANVWYHWSNLGKIQWNHIVSDKLFVQARLAENFNQYIFGQPFDRAIVAGVPTNGTLATFPVAGQPTASGLGFQDENSDRRSQMYFANVDLTYTASAHSTYYFGVGYERDNSAEHYYDYCGCDDATAGFGGFNLDGSYPNLFLAVDYPLTLPDFYFGTKQTFGKLTLEPSLRYDEETYQIPNRPDYTDPNTGKLVKTYAYGPYSTHAWSPRFAFTWAASPYDAIRGSYGVTTTFIPAAYVFNNSPNGVIAQDGRADSPYYPGTNLSNQRNYNVDLSYSHAFPNGVDSLRVSPFYRHSVDRLEASKNFVIDPATGLAVLSGTTYFRTGIQNKATGAEFGWNHVVRGDGLSSYLSATYVNYWGSLTPGALSGGTPYGSITSNAFSAQNAALRAFLATGTMFRNPSQPPWSVSWTGDLRKDRFHASPFVIYQVGAPYNVAGNTCMDQVNFSAIGSATKSCPPALNDYKVHFANANYWAAIDVGYDLIKHGSRVVTLGLNVRNLFENRFADVGPSTNSAYPSGTNPDVNTYGPGQVPGTLYYNAPDATPRQVQVYLQTRF
ncbi:MAG TPA: hypothetical protein VN224_07975, partial [Xanthomonadales bacterium]|nr:hypothetical protein [Xanthomonadales bacterium]